jgi:uncharacterized protein (DUF983 family)
MSYYPPVSPFAAGFSGKCPRCGQGALFKSFLGLNDRCPVCALDLSKAEAGDGPAVFIIFIVGFVAVVVAFVARFVWYAPIAAAFGISAGVAVALSLALLRPFKATLVALQYKHKAEEGRLEE